MCKARAWNQKQKTTARMKVIIYSIIALVSLIVCSMVALVMFVDYLGKRI